MTWRTRFLVVGERTILKSVQVPIPQTSGTFSASESSSFARTIRIAETAIKSFKLDYVGDARYTDIVQVASRIEAIDDYEVEFSVRANYSGGTYSGEVSVLIIADVEERPPIN